MDDTLINIMRWGQQGYNCSQVLLLMGLESRGQSNPDLVRSMAGLAYGGGTGQATCGVLTGGCCLLAYSAVDPQEPGKSAEQLPAMLQALGDWFHERVMPAHGGTACETIVGQAGPAASRQTCGTLLADTYHRVLEILAEFGFDMC